MSKKTKTKFKLLPYQVLARHWLWPAFLLIPAGVGLWWAVPQVEPLPDQYAFLGFVISGVGLLLVIYTLLAKRARVSCRRESFVVQTPLYPVAFSYNRVTIVRPVEFRSFRPPDEEKRARWRMYQELWGKTVPVIELKGFPLPHWWLRMWLHPYLFHPRDTHSLVLPVEEWLDFTRTLETLRTEWRESQRRSKSSYY